MAESQWVGLLVLAGGIFAIAASVGDWDFFMNSRKAKAWVKRIGRDNARKMYGGIGIFVAFFGLYMIIFAPGDEQSQVAQVTPGSDNLSNPNGRITQPPNPPQSQPPQTPVFVEYGDFSTTNQNPPVNNGSFTPTTSTPTPPTASPPVTNQPATVPTDTKPSVSPTNQPTPQASSPQPMVTQIPEGAIDLLPTINPERDKVKAKFSIQNGNLITPLAKPAILQVPVTLPANYRVTAIVEELKTDGNGSLGMGVNVQGHGVSVVIAGTNGDTSGLQLVDNKITRVNPTYRRGPLMKSGLNKIVVTVVDEQITVEVNDETIIDWNEPERLSLGFEAKLANKDQLRVGSWAGSYRISQLTIQKIEN